MRALVLFWLRGERLSPADHAALDRLTGRFGLGVAGLTATIFAIQLIRFFMGVHL